MTIPASGETDTPTSSGTNAVAVADKIASWVKEYGLQGVDIDYEVRLQFVLTSMTVN